MQQAEENKSSKYRTCVCHDCLKDIIAKDSRVYPLPTHNVPLCDPCVKKRGKNPNDYETSKEADARILKDKENFSHSTKKKT